MSKKHGARLLAGLSKLVEDQKRSNEEGSPPKEPKNLTALANKTETAGEYFEKVLKSSSLQDRYMEFQKFRKNCPKLLPAVHLELDQLVKHELRVQPVDVDEPCWNPAGSEPLLPALSNKLGLSVDKSHQSPVVCSATNC